MSTFSHYRITSDQQVPDITPDNITSISHGTAVDQLKDLKIKVTKLTDELIEFDLIGVDVSIANALRRILIAEVRKRQDRLRSDDTIRSTHESSIKLLFLCDELGAYHSHRECLDST